MSTQTGRNLLIGQSGGATAVLNASLAGAVETAQRSRHFQEIYGMHYGIKGLLHEDLLDLGRQPASLWARLRETPAAALGSCRYKLQEEDLARLFPILDRYQIHDVLSIGGNDTADTSHRLATAAAQQGYDLRVIGIPKTIDNDLPSTDHCPGYGTAARFIALATMHATMNMLALPEEYPIKCIETMGRDAGWLVAASALGKREADDPPHLLLYPEHPFQEDAFLAQVEKIYRRLGHVVIVVSEALRDPQGHPVGSTTERDAFGHPMVSNAAFHLVNMIQKRLQLRARFDRPGDIQWNGISHTDREEAWRVGEAAVHLLLTGQTDQMVTLIREEGSLYHCTTGAVALTEIAHQQRFLPEAFLTADRTMVTQQFYDYALPLIGDPLPLYARIEPLAVRNE